MVVEQRYQKGILPYLGSFFIMTKLMERPSFPEYYSPKQVALFLGGLLFYAHFSFVLIPSFRMRY